MRNMPLWRGQIHHRRHLFSRCLTPCGSDNGRVPPRISPALRWGTSPPTVFECESKSPWVSKVVNQSVELGDDQFRAPPQNVALLLQNHVQ
eukprot:NODE_20156_length_810_cov_5.206442.p2 GENE.NODE_20156_length_810_cov_5.206442~~NODE_20156_length_810_cov_5.206442.p2  ORF type:complete len:91 (+),score=6.60 NODE_20156_length_810_cov_5.206442:324-596(+)